MAKARERKKEAVTLEQRSSGLLLHPTSLPGPHGSGDIGPAAHQFVEDLARAGQRWWQMLPVVPPGPGESPYSSTSALAGSRWLVSLDLLAGEGLLKRSELGGVKGDVRLIDFERTYAYREDRLRRAFSRFGRGRELEAYVRRYAWVEDWALYAALRSETGEPWTEWPRDLRLRRPAALAAARERLGEEVRFEQFVQYQFDRQWEALREKCRALGVGLIGDVPIFVGTDSADVWANQHLFVLDREGRPTILSGYPPDPFAKQGQLWGHPHYRWPVHQKEGFRWWVERFKETMRRFDAVRIDHFLGFEKLWAVPAKAKNAKKGRWVRTPGRELLEAVRGALGAVQIIAEDLGNVTPGAAKLRDDLGLPGMRVLQFGFGDATQYLPHEYVPNCVAYTGTHDNETLVGWLDRIRKQDKGQHEKAVAYLGRPSKRAAHWSAIRALMMSVANTVVFPAQDLLGLGNKDRMNLPGEAEGNWGWRLRPKELGREEWGRLEEMAELYGRSGRGKPG